MESYDKNRTHNLLIALTHQISFSTIHFIHFVLLLCPMLLSHAPLAFTPPLPLPPTAGFAGPCYLHMHKN